MKRAICLIATAALLSSSVALADPMTIDLDTMTPDQLKELISMAEEEYEEATRFSSSDYNLLRENFEAAFESLIPDGASASYPLFGFNKVRKREMYKIYGTCEIKYADKSRAELYMHMIYWHDEANNVFHQVAFYSNEKVYYCDHELLQNVMPYLSESDMEKLNASEISYQASSAQATDVPTSSPLQTETPAPVHTASPTPALVPTPSPTPSPTTVPTPTPTVTPIPTAATQETYIEDALKVALGDQFIRFENNNFGKNINVYFELGPAWSNKAYRTGFLMDCADILKALDGLTGQGKISYDTLYIEADTEFIDIYGNKSSGKAMTIDITSDIVSKINWDGFLSDNLESIATNYWCHKSLRD